jgi:uncharacterized 2Fe-2S/4Fe-4S cluster protein (DUF4445 family)
MTVAVPEASQSVILTEGIGSTVASGQDGYLLAFDIGTTTVAGYLLDGKTGKELASHSRRNPQAVFGADVISRIGHALDGQASASTESIGTTPSNAIRMFIAAFNRAGTFPFEVGVKGVLGRAATSNE